MVKWKRILDGATPTSVNDYFTRTYRSYRNMGCSY